MDFEDIPRINIDGQELLVPTTEIWRQLLKLNSIDGLSIPMPDHISGWLDDFGKFSVARLALHRTYRLIPKI
jgi:hypothetical protein